MDGKPGLPARRRPSWCGHLEVGDEDGLLPEVTWRAREPGVDVNNCAFREVSSTQPDLVCAMHRAFLEGFIASLAAAGSEAALQASSALSSGDDRCRLRIIFTETATG